MYRQKKISPKQVGRGLAMYGRAARFVRETRENSSLKFKGGIAGKYGVEVHDPVQTARYDLLLLDSGARAFGNGHFNPSKGEFVRDSRVKEGEVCTEPADHGPIIPGDRYILYGRGTPPGADHPMSTSPENVRAFYRLRQTGVGPDDGLWKRTHRQKHDTRDYDKATTYLHDRD